MTSISIIGAGAWGSALAQLLAGANTPITLWTRFEDHACEINAQNENKRYLGGYPLSPHINATSDLKTALKGEIILMVTPTQALRTILHEMKPNISKHHKLVLCSKGIEQETAKLTTEILGEIITNISVSVMSGPNFATDIADGKPAATTLACSGTENDASVIQAAITRPTFRPYLSDDIIGTQLAGALKNVIAIACGIAHGREMGQSACASLVTRGLLEISRLGIAMGGRQETFMGLCGVGDMMLTCTSHTSRNFSLGYELGRGTPLNDILKSRNTVAEGVHTAKSATLLSNRYRVDMPISTAVYKCLYDGLSLDDIMQDMLNRPVGREL
ncbi:MAG: NAD(P)H-dependent glycerol-3-phosphate dehydrogenase [Alphaproteobacteria bacterium]